jgi:hypothetical protein
MAGVNPNGDEKYWLNGLPFDGVSFTPADTGTEKFWLDGLSEEYLFPQNNLQSSFFLIFN